MRELEARLAAAGALPDASRAGIRKAAEELLEQSRALPAPCGCTPGPRCDRHCRVKIRPAGRNLYGELIWFAECDGYEGLLLGAALATSLPSLHTWGVDHVTGHRTAGLRGGTDA